MHAWMSGQREEVDGSESREDKAGPPKTNRPANRVTTTKILRQRFGTIAGIRGWLYGINRRRRTYGCTLVVSVFDVEGGREGGREEEEEEEEEEHQDITHTLPSPHPSALLARVPRKGSSARWRQQVAGDSRFACARGLAPLGH